MKAPGGVSTNGDKGNDMPPMNPGGELSLMDPKAYMGLGLCKLNPNSNGFLKSIPELISVDKLAVGIEPFVHVNCDIYVPKHPRVYKKGAQKTPTSVRG